MRLLIQRLRNLFRPHQLEMDLAEELEFHREKTQHDLEVRGLEPAEAALASRRALGGAVLAREHARDVWRWLEDLVRDVRHRLRAFDARRSVPRRTSSKAPCLVR